jgi:integrase
LGAAAVTKHSKVYWRDRVFQPVIKGVKVDNYVVQMSSGGVQRSLSLRTPNKEEAAQTARDWFVFLSANGWATFDATYRNKSALVSSPKFAGIVKSTGVTVGDFVTAARNESDLAHRTIDDYIRCFRYIVSEIRTLTKTRSRYDYRKDGHKAWAAAIDATPLAAITPDQIRAWKRAYVARAGHDELLRKRYTVSCNSYLRRARTLFSKPKVISKLRSVKLSDVLPFDDVELERRTDTKFYGCGVDAVTLLRSAVDELAGNQVELLKVFLLAITLGLRRREIDLLEWQSLDFVTGTLRILPTKWYQLKTPESSSELPVEPEILELFRGWRARATDTFVIESDRAPKVTDYQHYRCDDTFQSLLAWLRGKGVQSNKPLHALRKLYGSALADAHGLHVASSGLRHADVRTTAEYYVDRRVRVTAGFGKILSDNNEIAFLPKEASAGS